MRIVSEKPEIQARFEKSKAAGAPDWLAEIYAFQQGPGTHCQGGHLARTKMLADQFKGDEKTLKTLQADAKRRGIPIHQYGHYEPRLARHIGDALAVIPPTDPVGHVKEVCERGGLKSSMGVEYTSESYRRIIEKRHREEERKPSAQEQKE